MNCDLFADLEDDGIAILELADQGEASPEGRDEPTRITFSENFACPVSGFTIPEIEPRLFSFNAPFGACPSCEVRVLDMHDPNVAARARALGIRSVPAVAVDGQLADCCAGRSVDLDRLKELGLGRPV